MIRRILAVVGGILTGSLAIWLMETLGHYLYPLPAGVGPNNMAEFKEYVSNLPFPALLLVIVGYALGAVVSGFVSTKIGKDGKNRYALICGVFFLLATVYNMSVLPTPIWFWILGIIVWALVLVGYRLALNKKTI